MTDIYKWLFGGRGREAVRNPLPLMPEALQAHAVAIAATAEPFVGASVLEGPPPSPTGSQLGGRPWWPKGLAFPTGADGEPLYLLAQINFAEMPALEPFPRRGLLQLFIAADDLYGLDLDDPGRASGFRCIFHETTTGPADTKSPPRKLRAFGHLPLVTPLAARALTFERGQMVVDLSDYRFGRLLPEIAEDEDLVEAYADWTSGAAAAPAIRLGGYPSFTQSDPREDAALAGIGDTNLLTVDTTTGIMWGDSGVAQFFIVARDLERRDFSRVAYNWDCC